MSAPLLYCSTETQHVARLAGSNRFQSQYWGTEPLTQRAVIGRRRPLSAAVASSGAEKSACPEPQTTYLLHPPAASTHRRGEAGPTGADAAPAPASQDDSDPV